MPTKKGGKLRKKYKREEHIDVAHYIQKQTRYGMNAPCAAKRSGSRRFQGSDHTDREPYKAIELLVVVA